MFLSLSCTSVAANFRVFLYKGTLKEITPTTLHKFSSGVPCAILNLAAHKSIRRDKQNSYFHRGIMENTELQLQVRNCLWNLWETPFPRLHKVSFDMSQYGWNIKYP